jgi:hypothetical protein
LKVRNAYHQSSTFLRECVLVSGLDALKLRSSDQWIRIDPPKLGGEHPGTILIQRQYSGDLVQKRRHVFSQAHSSVVLRGLSFKLHLQTSKKLLLQLFNERTFTTTADPTSRLLSAIQTHRQQTKGPSNIMLWKSEILRVARCPAQGQADLCRP